MSTFHLGLAGALGLAAAGCQRLDDIWNASSSRTVAMARADASSATRANPLEPAESEAGAADPSIVVEVDAALEGDASSVASADAAAAGAEAPRPTIVALAFRAGVVERPQAGAPWVGYLRAGSAVPIVTGPVGNDGCPARRDTPGAGWYQVAGGGFVCVGPLAALGSHLAAHPPARRLPVQPELDASLPYTYAINYRPTVMYRWLPSPEDEREVEPERFAPRPPRLASNEAVSVPGPVHHAGDAGVAAVISDASTDAGDASVRIEDLEGMPGTPLLRRMTRGMYVSLDREVRRFWRTQSGGFLRAGTVSALRSPPTFQGLRLDAAHRLPVGFAISTVSQTYRMAGRTMVPQDRVPRLTAFFLAPDPPVTVGREQYYRTVEGVFVRSRQVRVITAHAPPADLGPGEKWVDVNLDHQSVVAYEGATPVYVTVASTGRRNRTNPDENYETLQGGFRIQSKHVATTMDGNSASDGPYSIEDVPWVMYFEQSFALHGAFWHNVFGVMHSHGCVNLAPADAHWFFDWSEPRLPVGWHAVFSNPAHPGTRVYVHYDDQPLGMRGGPERPPPH